MNETDQLAHPETIAGYDLVTGSGARSPLGLDELEQLKAAAGLTNDDGRYLRMAGELLADQAPEMVDCWRAMLGEHAHLALYGSQPDGTPNPEYAAASHPRFARWIIDACTRPHDQAWLDYQEEIGLRHTRAKKNQTDNADSVEHIPLRYFLAFVGPVLVTSREFLSRGGHSAQDVDRMHAAWTKSVLLHMSLWSRPYVIAGDW